MDNSTDDTNSLDGAPQSDSEILRAEVVEVLPPTDWQWSTVRPVVRRRRWRLPLLLFVATCLSTTLVGGLWYAVPVMIILVCHEMGHFIQTRRYGVYASFPYFIPVPAPPLGTLGAVIAMEPRVGDRRALFDIGISGPLAGLAPTILFLVVGLQYSHIGPPDHASYLRFGDPLLFTFLAHLRFGPIPAGFEVYVDPMAFAGWVGLLITSLNLFPIGQLDGGHILYALLRRRAHKVATLMLCAAVLLVILYWDQLWNWSLMLLLLILMGPIHPPTADDDEPLGAWRYVLGWLTLAFIFIGFTPMPIQPL